MSGGSGFRGQGNEKRSSGPVLLQRLLYLASRDPGKQRKTPPELWLESAFCLPFERAAPGGAPNEGEKPIKLGPAIAGLVRFAIEQTADCPASR